jgi:hypothetical protein
MFFAARSEQTGTSYESMFRVILSSLLQRRNRRRGILEFSAETKAAIA